MSGPLHFLKVSLLLFWASKVKRKIRTNTQFITDVYYAQCNNAPGTSEVNRVSVGQGRSPVHHF